MTLQYPYDDFCQTINYNLAGSGSWPTVVISGITYKIFPIINAANYTKTLPQGTTNVGRELNHFELTISGNVAPISVIGRLNGGVLTDPSKIAGGTKVDFGSVTQNVMVRVSGTPGGQVETWKDMSCFWLLVKSTDIGSLVSVSVKAWVGYGTGCGHYGAVLGSFGTYQFAGAPFNFLISFPKNYDSTQSKTYPLVLSAAGDGSQGCNGVKLYVYSIDTLGSRLASTYNYHNPSYECISVIFQWADIVTGCGAEDPYGTSSGPPYYGIPGILHENGWESNALISFTQNLISNPDYKIDTDRIYISGFSRGSTNLWPVLFTGRDLWAAAWFHFEGYNYRTDAKFNGEDFIGIATNSEILPMNWSPTTNGLSLWQYMVKRINHINVARFFTNHAYLGPDKLWTGINVNGIFLDVEKKVFDDSGGKTMHLFYYNIPSHGPELSFPASNTSNLDDLFATTRGVVAADPYPNMDYPLVRLHMTVPSEDIQRGDPVVISFSLTNSPNADLSYDSIDITWSIENVVDDTAIDISDCSPTSGIVNITGTSGSFQVLTTVKQSIRDYMTIRIESAIVHYYNRDEYVLIENLTNDLFVVWIASYGYPDDIYEPENNLVSTAPIAPYIFNTIPYNEDIYKIYLQSGQNIKIYLSGPVWQNFVSGIDKWTDKIPIDMLLPSGEKIYRIGDNSSCGVCVNSDYPQFPWYDSSLNKYPVIYQNWFGYKAKETGYHYVDFHAYELKNIASSFPDSTHGLDIELLFGLSPLTATDIVHFSPYRLITEIPDHTYTVAFGTEQLSIVDDGGVLTFDGHALPDADNSYSFSVDNSIYIIIYRETRSFLYSGHHYVSQSNLGPPPYGIVYADTFHGIVDGGNYTYGDSKVFEILKYTNSPLISTPHNTLAKAATFDDGYKFTYTLPSPSSFVFAMDLVANEKVRVYSVVSLGDNPITIEFYNVISGEDNTLKSRTSALIDIDTFYLDSDPILSDDMISSEMIRRTFIADADGTYSMHYTVYSDGSAYSEPTTIYIARELSQSKPRIVSTDFSRFWLTAAEGETSQLFFGQDIVELTISSGSILVNGVTLSSVGDNVLFPANNGIYKIEIADTGSFIIDVIKESASFSGKTLLFVYRENDIDSEAVADYYLAKYDLDSSYKFAVPCSTDEILASRTDFYNQIEDPILQHMLLYGYDPEIIILGYNVPGGFIDGTDIISSTSRVSRLLFSYTKKTQNPLYNIQNTDDYTAASLSAMAKVTSRIDGPTVEFAKAMIDVSASSKDQLYMNGGFVLDPYSDLDTEPAIQYKEDLLYFYNTILQDITLPFALTTTADPYIDPVIPYLQHESMYWGWFTDRTTNTFFRETDTQRIFFYNADYDGAFSIRDESDERLCGLSLRNGYGSSAGSMSNPGIDGFLRPTPFLKSLIKGFYIGEAYLISSPYLDWTISFFGDPLVNIEIKYTEPASEEINEHETWRLTTEELSKSISSEIAKSDSLKASVDLIVNSSDVTLGVNTLQPSYDAYLSSTNISQMFYSSVSSLLLVPISNFGYTSLSSYLLDKGYNLSERITDVIGGTDKTGTEDFSYPEGYWQREHVIIDEHIGVASTYNFILQVSDVSDFSNIIFEIDSSISNDNWYYEIEKNIFTNMPADGVSSAFVSRKVIYKSIDLQYLTRLQLYYFRMQQKDFLGEYGYTDYSDIIWT